LGRAADAAVSWDTRRERGMLVIHSVIFVLETVWVGERENYLFSFSLGTRVILFLTFSINNTLFVSLEPGFYKFTLSGFFFF